MATKKTPEEIEPVSDRITFTIIPIDIVPMNRKLQEQAFLRELRINIHWLGGVFKQSWAITVTGDPAKVEEFIDWGKTHRTEIESPKFV